MSDGTQVEVHDRGTESPHTDRVGVSRTGRHWKRWEIGQLLDRAARGETTEQIALALNRTPEALQRELDRLVAGEIDCPAEYADPLNRLTIRLSSPPPPPRTTRPARPAENRSGYEAALADVRKQYELLEKTLGDVRRSLGDVKRLLIHSLAVDLVSGHITEREVARFCQPNAFRDVLAVRDQIADFRDAQQRVLDGQTVKPEDTPTEKPPLVMTGPGGDFVRKYPREQ